MSKEDKDFIIEDSKRFLELRWSIKKCHNAIKQTYESAPDYSTFYKWLDDAKLIFGYQERSSPYNDKIPDIRDHSAPSRDRKTKLGQVLEDNTFKAVKELSEEKYYKIVYVENAKKPSAGSDIWFLTANPFQIYEIECKNWDVAHWKLPEFLQKDLVKEVADRFENNKKRFNKNRALQKLSIYYTARRFVISAGIPSEELSQARKIILECFDKAFNFLIVSLSIIPLSDKVFKRKTAKRVFIIKQKLAKYLDNDIRMLELEKKGLI
jgi:hypothetical protein